MSYKEFVDRVRPEFEKAFKFFEQELAKIRTSRASPAMIEDIEVSCFGQKFPLKQLGSISAPATNQLVVQPWDTSYLEPIQTAISNSGLGMSAVVDKNVIRLNLPLLTEEYRNALTKTLNEKAEQTRQTLRHLRDDCWSKIQTAQKEKQISEDDKFRGKDELQKLIDDYQEKIKNLVAKKQSEVA
jgi:ribosome recycling factor